jgi:hypothetical protein
MIHSVRQRACFPFQHGFLFFVALALFIPGGNDWTEGWIFLSDFILQLAIAFFFGTRTLRSLSPEAGFTKGPSPGTGRRSQY